MAVEQCLPLLHKAPPGQLQQVYHDVRGIISASSVEPAADLSILARPHLDRYCQEQLMVVPVAFSGKVEGAVLCEQAVVQNGDELRMSHPRLQCSFRYDPIQGTTSDVRAGRYKHSLTEFCTEIDKAASKYVSNHFYDGVVTVFASEGSFEEEQIAGQEEPTEQTGNARSSDRQEEDILDPLQGEELQKNDDQAIEPTAQASGSVATSLGKHDEIGSDKQPGMVSEPKDTEDDIVKDHHPSSQEPTELPNSANDGTEQDTQEKLDADVQASDADPATSMPRDSSSATQRDENNPSLASDPSCTLLTIHIVGNKSNLRNFWSGRWRSTYVVDAQSGRFEKASIQVDAHYFENGNVQLKTQTENVPTLETPKSPSQSLAKAVISTIEKHQQAYQQSLFRTTDNLRERSFKALRRTLPITRQKIDWDKAASYDIGSELANH
ncbi:F-actin-capping protein subunit alpha [Malassezia yamatoensis]|uniref:F-actin-capping protein subunit alpha n=1 Tax=Malassezia yamatoensis TaxID=253288 RepID=A0AAJ6CIT3_9BASI|nr:F-actin-capping protein subunit alpha [Malassezia yamatoensis]